MTEIRECRSCGARLEMTLLDLGTTPSANAYLRAESLSEPEPVYPLHAMVCSRCFLVQIGAEVTPESLFSDYAYFSSYSDSWLEHSRDLARQCVQRLGLDATTLVVEIASNDGYLLKYFLNEGVPVLGVEPAANVAQVAVASGVPTMVDFFGERLARRMTADGIEPELVVGNNVLAHVPDLNDFVAGLAVLLSGGGLLVMEFPHLLHLLEQTQFDTIYHEHFSYFSLLAVENVLGRHGLAVYDVEEIPTHGGSLRVWVGNTDRIERPVTDRVTNLRRREQVFGLADLDTYAAFSQRVDRVLDSLASFIDTAVSEGKTIVAYGAAAKGTTLLNTLGPRARAISFVVDRNPHKQGLYLPGSHLEIRAPEAVASVRPDYLLILPWNLVDEITAAMASIREWGGRFVTAIPECRVF